LLLETASNIIRNALFLERSQNRASAVDFHGHTAGDSSRLLQKSVGTPGKPASNEAPYHDVNERVVSFILNAKGVWIIKDGLRYLIVVE
jgi:hypothetical protein